MKSAALNCLLKNICVHPIVIAELKLRDVKRHIFCAHLVERADHAAFEDRPEPFDGLSVDRAHNVLALGMIDDTMRIFFSELLISGPLVGAEQADFVRDGLAHESYQRIGADVLDKRATTLPLRLTAPTIGVLPEPTPPVPSPPPRLSQ
jgi:hypothetical protein